MDENQVFITIELTEHELSLIKQAARLEFEDFNEFIIVAAVNAAQVAIHEAKSNGN